MSEPGPVISCIRCSAILFDLDGVLVDSRAVVERHWTRWAIEHGLDPAYVIERAHGRPTIETIREVLPDGDAQAELLVIEGREIADVEGVHVIPGAADLLASIPPDRWTVVTSGTRALAEPRMRHVGLPVPRAMITASDITRGKPDPEPYRKGAAALGYSTRECVVIEDAPAGIVSGQAAGARVIAVPTTYSRQEIAAADYIVERLSDLRVAAAADGLELQLSDK